MLAKTKFDVNKPQATITATTPGAVAVDNLWDGSGAMALHFGSKIGPPGIRFERTHDPVALWDWLQIINNSVRRQHDSISYEWRRSSGQGLDTAFPYPVAEVNFRTSDAPGFGVAAGADEATANDSFTMYLMYRPGGAGAIYVPVASVGWGWAGRAAFTNGAWDLIDDPAYPTTPAVGPSLDAVDYPTWNNNFSAWRDQWLLE